MSQYLPLRRLLANCLDIQIQLLYLIGSWHLLDLLQAGVYHLPAWLLLLLGFVSIWLLAESRNHATPGKALLGLSLDFGKAQGWRRGLRLLMRNALKTGSLMLTALLALELLPPPAFSQFEPKLALALRLLSALSSIAAFAILINFWILSPRMTQFWPGKCLHDWATGCQVVARPAFNRAHLPARIRMALLAIMLLLIGLFLSLELLLHLGL